MMSHMVDLMLVVPHPDDEVFSCGGLFSRMSQFNKRVATITLTRGGAGRTLGICSQEELPTVREVELRASLATLGVTDPFIYDYPDGGLMDVSDEEIVPKLIKHLQQLKPEVLLTFPPNGSNGHPDHVRTNQLVRRALALADHKIKALYYYASERPYDGAAREGFLPPEEIRAHHLPPTHYIEVGEFLENKMRAMGAYETQARSVLNFMRKYSRRLMFESFHRAFPVFPEGEGPRAVPWL